MNPGCIPSWVELRVRRTAFFLSNHFAAHSSTFLTRRQDFCWRFPLSFTCGWFSWGGRCRVGWCGHFARHANIQKSIVVRGDFLSKTWYCKWFWKRIAEFCIGGRFTCLFLRPGNFCKKRELWGNIDFPFSTNWHREVRFRARLLPCADWTAGGWKLVGSDRTYSITGETWIRPNWGLRMRRIVLFRWRNIFVHSIIKLVAF